MTAKLLRVFLNLAENEAQIHNSLGGSFRRCREFRVYLRFRRRRPVPSHSYPAQLSKEMPVLLLNDASNTSKINKFCSAEQRNGRNFTQRLSKPHRDYLSHKGLNLIWND